MSLHKWSNVCCGCGKGTRYRIPNGAGYEFCEECFNEFRIILSQSLNVKEAIEKFLKKKREEGRVVIDVFT